MPDELGEGGGHGHAGEDPGTDAWGTSRRSRLFPGPFLVHADLHNHTRLSDGRGDPARAFASMRAAGLDVAAITDHSRWAGLFLGLPLAPPWTGIDRRAWARTAALADQADEPGRFVALRGFEWSHGSQGHVSVWASRRWTEPLRTFGPGMAPLWRWLEGAGADGLVGFNHPGMGGRRRFGRFGYRPAMAERLVSMEIFNKTLDYLFQGTDRREPSPLLQCLDAGWRVGLLGVTDEHGDDWGVPEGKGRAGLYVHELSRAGVLEALAARRVFASRAKGLRLDAAVEGVRMGGAVHLERVRPLRVEVDLDRGPAWPGRPLSVQVLRPGAGMPTLAAAVEVVPGGPGGPAAFEVEVDPAAGDWLVLRVSDPAGPADPRARGPWAELGYGLAYSSPFWLRP
ncbi:MAG TPA: CehA/McbA family metallohydrolase [Actinomycetes bacterium]|nr:CehA/McbA family metallohydrolase [Actinomycetes bacterium]